LLVTVSELAIAPIKGMRLQRRAEIWLGDHGVTGDREFLIVDDDGKLVLTARNPGLLRIEPSWEPAQNLLALRFPDGSVVQDAPGPGTAAVTRTYGGREIPGQVISGPLSAALSGYTAVDPRRFRMTITVTGADPWAEHSWSGQQVTIGDITLRVLAPVPRCVITTRNPESGATDARILHALARLRGKNDITFGVWCEIIQPGHIHVGDLVTPP
jgi:uncharacterized protein YcbX